MIGFNNVGFDYAVIHPFLLADFEPDGNKLAKALYKRAQHLISEEKREWIKPIVPQRDLFLIWHFNNKARATSLKWLQVCMDWKNVQEMPISHDTNVTEEMIPMILEYNENDTLSTLEFYKRSKSRIVLRKTLSEKYGIDMGNFSDNKIGEQILLKGISQRTGLSIQTLRKGRTFRKNIAVKDTLVPLDFSSTEFRQVYNDFRKMVLTSTKKKDLDKSVIDCVFDGMKYEFGLGGLHAFRGSGIYKNIQSADVSSYYPNLSIKLKLHPKHLGMAFCDAYEDGFNERNSYPKGSDENTGLKFGINGVFGLTNAEWSPFYDPAMTMSTTLNGQFFLALLCERITESLSGRIIMANTDGIEVDVLDAEEFKKICEEWQKEFKLNLEFNTYKVLAARDVNNYQGVFENGKVKEKGAFETERELYKNQSMKIVRTAVRRYFVDRVPVERTINECKDISQFLIGKRAKTGNLEYRAVEGYDLKAEKLPKNVRYFISKSGGAIVKLTKQHKTKKQIDDTVRVVLNQMTLFDMGYTNESQLVEKIKSDRLNKFHPGYRMTMFNKWFDRSFEDYGVEKRFYVNEANKLIDSVIKQQTTI